MFTNVSIPFLVKLKYKPSVSLYIIMQIARHTIIKKIGKIWEINLIEPL